jgi:hypothetical protein
MRRIIIIRLTGVAAIVGLLSSAGCGADEPAAPPVCASLDAVRATAEHIRNTNVSENGVGQMRTYLGQLRTDLEQLATDAAAQFGPQTQQLRAATDNLSASITTARTVPNADNLQSVRDAAGAVRANVQILRDAAAGTC